MGYIKLNVKEIINSHTITSMAVSLFEGSYKELCIYVNDKQWKIYETYDFEEMFYLLHPNNLDDSLLKNSDYNYILSVLEDKYNKSISELTLNLFNYVDIQPNEIDVQYQHYYGGTIDFQP